MPLYEYQCQHCQQKVTLYLGTFSQSHGTCPRCGSSTLKRLFSTFSVGKTDQEVYEDILSDSRLTSGMMNNDPAALAEWNKRITRREDKVAPEYEDMLGRMEQGEPPDKNEKSGQQE